MHARLIVLLFAFTQVVGYYNFRGSTPLTPRAQYHFAQLSRVGVGIIPMMPGGAPMAPIATSSSMPAPSAVSVQSAMSPPVVSPQAGNKAACSSPAAAPGGAGAAAPASSCVVSGSASTPTVKDNTGIIVGSVIGGIFGLITIGAIVQKYKTMGSYSSFWGRMVGLASGACGFGIGYIDFSFHSKNDCDNLFGDPFMSSPCPCVACSYLLFAYGIFQIGFNMPFLYANEKTISKMYASFGLFNQAAVMLVVSLGVTAGIKLMYGSLLGMVFGAMGVVAGILFALGYFKGEDGVLGRMFQSAKDMLNDATAAASIMVDDSLKVFGLNADERSKVTTQNVYNFCRVVRGPNWSAGDEDGGPEGPGGEVIGYIGENGVSDGVPVSTGKQGWCKVKWDSPIPGKAGKTAEYRIGADQKYELKFVEETEGVVDKLMGQTFAMFGYNPSANPQPTKEKKQIEFMLTSRLPGEEEPEAEPELNDDTDDESSVSAKAKEKAIKAATAAAAAASKEMLAMACSVYDAYGKKIDTCDDVKPMLFKSAIRHRQLGNKQDAIVVELQKVPDNVGLICLWAKVPEGAKLGKFERMSVRSTSTGKDLTRLSVPLNEGTKNIGAHKGSEGFLFFILYAVEPGKWYAQNVGASLGAGGVGLALDAEIGKFLEAREKKSKKKKLEDVSGKNVSELINVEEIFENIKIEVRCEAQAREMMSTQMTTLQTALASKLRAQGVAAQTADLQARKIALLQISKQHQAIFQKTLVLRRAMYLKQKMHPVQAMIMAKKDANRAALYMGKEAEIRQAVMNTIAEEKAATEEAKRLQEAEYANTYTGQASAMMGSLLGWGASAEEPEQHKKKKKKKKDEDEQPAAPPAAAPASSTVPPQLQNLTPQQIAAVRAMQQKQQQAKQ